MATVEAMTQLLTQNAEFFRTMQQQQHQQVQEMLNLLQTMKAESGGGSDRRGEGLRRGGSKSWFTSVGPRRSGKSLA